MSTRHSFLSTTGLIRAPSNVTCPTTSKHAKAGDTKPGQQSHQDQPLIATKAGILPLGPRFLVGMALAFSLIFILSLSCAFVGSDEDEPPSKELLDGIAKDSPGIILIGDNVDIDVDEPAITIRWSIIGCGPAYILPGSEGTHGSTLCGLPQMALKVYVDSSSDPTSTYDPTQFPIVNTTGKRIGIQNLYQFDSDHVLDVHQARLYPFDTYQLTSTLRLTSSDGDEPVEIIRLTTLKLTTSFSVVPNDVLSYMNASDNAYEPSRDITLNISRPGEARMFTLMLFGVSWMLAHATLAFVVLAWMQKNEEQALRHLVFVFIVLLIIPQIRNAMPDAPGYDGVLLDNIGFFPQMLASGLSAVVLLTMIGSTERWFDGYGMGNRVLQNAERSTWTLNRDLSP